MIIKGEFKEGSAVIYKADNNVLIKGLLFEDGREKWFNGFFDEFECGLALVDNGKTSGYIDRSGNYRIPSIYTLGTRFSENRAFVSISDMTLLINEEGKMIHKWDESILPSEFSNGLAKISRVKDSGEVLTSGFIDKEGQTVIPFIEDHLIKRADYLINDSDDKYSCGLIRFCQNEQYGFIDQDINIRIPFMYDYASSFEDNIAAARVGTMAGFIDRDNKILIPFGFQTALNFSDGYATVKRSNKWGLIDMAGNITISFRYDFLSRCFNDHIVFEAEGKRGIMDIGQNILIPAQYDRILSYTGGICIFQNGNHYGVRDKRGRELKGETFILG